MNTELRKYKVADGNMQEHCKTMRAHFIDHQAAFAAFDVDYTSPFETSWKAAIDAAMAILPDEVIVDQITQLTVAVEKWMTKSRNKFQDSKYFIEKAFPDNEAVWDEFGFDNFKNQRADQLGLLEFMKVFFATATKYTAELTAAGFDAAAIAEIDTIGTSFENANTDQEKMKGSRGVITQSRVQLNNALWDLTVQVSRAGKIIYRNDPARFNLFLLPASDESTESLSISGTVTDSATSTPIANANISINSIGVNVTTDSNGKYGIAGLADGNYDLEVNAAGYTTQNIGGVVVDGSNDLSTTVDMALIVV